MTVWDNIYKKHLKTGKGYGTISKDIYPAFVDFIEKNEFPVKNALDIGFGTGKYLKLLKDRSFKLAGIDNSETAALITNEILGNEADLRVADMYEYQIPKGKYDLVISISTLHHGTKEQVRDLVKQIHNALVPEGKVFITLPDYKDSWHAKSKDIKELSKGTYIHLSGPEKDLPHSLYTKREIEEMFSPFQDVKMTMQSGRWFIRGTK